MVGVAFRVVTLALPITGNESQLDIIFGEVIAVRHGADC